MYTYNLYDYIHERNITCMRPNGIPGNAPNIFGGVISYRIVMIF